MTKLTLTFLLLFSVFLLKGQDFKPFKTTWQVANPDIIRVDFGSDEVDFDYTWTLTTDNTIQITGNHTTSDGIFETPFSQEGVYELAISVDTLSRFNNYPKDKLLDVTQWGDITWGSVNSMFEDWLGSSFSAVDTIDLSNVTDMREMFNGATNFNDDLDHWDVSNVTNMRQTFQDATAFNGNISTWNVSKVVSMFGTFQRCTVFNRDISGWITTNLTDLAFTFRSAVNFDQELNNWDVSKVRSLNGTFSAASEFNQDLSMWDVSNVRSMNSLFSGATKFDQDIGNWNVSSVTGMESCFQGASSFNQDISKWDVSGVTNMRQMFDNADAFNQPIGVWDVRNVSSFREMFRQNDAFNQSLGGWKFKNNTISTPGFSGARPFDCKELSSTLIGWNLGNPDLENLAIGGPLGEYDTLAAISRNELIARGWTLNSQQTLFEGNCEAEVEFPCHNEVTFSNDTLYSNLLIKAALKVDLENIVLVKPARIQIIAPVVNMSPTVATENEIVLEVVTEAGCAVDE